MQTNNEFLYKNFHSEKKVIIFFIEHCDHV